MRLPTVDGRLGLEGLTVPVFVLLMSTCSAAPLFFNHFESSLCNESTTLSSLESYSYI